MSAPDYCWKCNEIETFCMCDGAITNSEVEALTAKIEEMNSDSSARSHDRMYGDHYGPYGSVCANTGQLDAGTCWKCQIKALKADVEFLETQLETEDI